MIGDKTGGVKSLVLTDDASRYVIECTIGLLTEADYLSYDLFDDAIVTINSIDYYLFVEDLTETKSNQGVNYTVRLVSPTVKLDAPYAKTIVDSVGASTMAVAKIEELAAIAGITVDYQIYNASHQILDWFLPTGTLVINDETPLQVIKRIVNSVGGKVHTKPNGDMLITSLYPVSPMNWDSTLADYVLRIDNEITQIDTSIQINSGANAYVVNQNAVSSESIWLEELNDHAGKFILGFRVPWSDIPFGLQTSGGSEVQADMYQYPVTAEMPIQIAGEDNEEWEIIEFIDWVGNTSKPIYGSIVAWDWIEDSLGNNLNDDTQFEISEDGTIEALDKDNVPSEGLLRIKYNTKYWIWTIHGPEDKEIQFYVPELEEE